MLVYFKIFIFFQVQRERVSLFLKIFIYFQVQREPQHRARVRSRPGEGGPQEIPALLRTGKHLVS